MFRPFSTINVETTLEWDNRDFEYNPTRGSHQRVSYTKDLDGNDTFGGWEFWEAEITKLISLGPTSKLRPQVLAFGAKVAYVPTWETEEINGSTVVTRRPPPVEGATLGG